MNPFISVILSVYNGGDYLESAVDSILCQTHQNYEFIIVNDGSTDCTAAILLKFAKRDSRITLLTHSARQGLTKSLNHAIRIAQGNLIARQDADDISNPFRLEKQLAYLREHPHVCVLGSWYEIIDEAAEVKEQRRTPTTDWEALIYISKRWNPLAHGSVMFSRSICKKVNLYNEVYYYAQDYDLWLRMAQYGEMANLPEFLYKWRLHSHSISAYHSQEQEKTLRESLSACLIEFRSKLSSSRPSFRRMLIHAAFDLAKVSTLIEAHDLVGLQSHISTQCNQYPEYLRNYSKELIDTLDVLLQASRVQSDPQILTILARMLQNAQAVKP